MDSSIMWFLLAVLFLAGSLLSGITFINRKRSGLDRDYYLREWQKIENFRANGSAGYQLAVMEADKLLDHALKQRGISGETMGERLKAAKHSFRNNDEIWGAHKLRNRLAHEQNVKINGLITSNALRGFKNGLKDLGAL